MTPDCDRLNLRIDREYARQAQIYNDLRHLHDELADLKDRRDKTSQELNSAAFARDALNSSVGAVTRGASAVGLAASSLARTTGALGIERLESELASLDTATLRL